MSRTTAEKQRMVVTLNATNLAAAPELGLNVSAISEATCYCYLPIARAASTASGENRALKSSGLHSLREPAI